MYSWTAVNNRFIINSDTFHMSYGKSQELPRIAKIILPSKTVLPPNSAVHINEQLTEKLSRNYVMEPQNDIPVLMPRCMYSEQTMSRLCLVNASDRFYTIQKGTVGEAVAADPVDMSVEKKPITNLSKIPDYLYPLLQKSVRNLSESQQIQFENLVAEYQDVFDENGFDLENFIEIEHAIDTGTASPIKQRMR